jgi:hypothetical protein
MSSPRQTFQHRPPRNERNRDQKRDDKRGHDRPERRGRTRRACQVDPGENQPHERRSRQRDAEQQHERGDAAPDPLAAKLREGEARRPDPSRRDVVPPAAARARATRRQRSRPPRRRQPIARSATGGGRDVRQLTRPCSTGPPRRRRPGSSWPVPGRSRRAGATSIGGPALWPAASASAPVLMAAGTTWARRAYGGPRSPGGRGWRRRGAYGGLRTTVTGRRRRSPQRSAAVSDDGGFRPPVALR